MDVINALEEAWRSGAAVVGGITAGELQAPTPCSNWDVRALLNHTLGECQMMTLVNRGEGLEDQADFVGDAGDLLATWERLGRENVASWRDGGLEGERTYFYGTFPAGVAALINLGEVVVHGWDLARATAQEPIVDPTIAHMVYEFYAKVPLEGMRAAGQLGPEIVVGPNSPADQRLLALLGRQP